MIGAAYVLLLLWLTNVDGKEIKIKIDSDDILKLMSGFVNTDTFRRFADQVVQRTAIKYEAVLSNPYHPEDTVVSNFEAIKNKHEKTLAELKEDKENAQIDANLERENSNFVSNNEDQIEDLLTDNEHSAGPVSATVRDPHLDKSTKGFIVKYSNQKTNEKKLEKPLHESIIASDDREGFKEHQRRFSVMKSH